MNRFKVYEYIRKDDKFYEVGWALDIKTWFRMMDWPGECDPAVAASLHITDLFFTRFDATGLIIYNSDALSLLTEIKTKEMLSENQNVCKPNP